MKIIRVYCFQLWHNNRYNVISISNTSLNHQLLSLILDKASFNKKVFILFSDYLINRQTYYIWNNFVSPFSEQI